MEGGQKFNIPLNASIDTDSNDMLVPVTHPLLSHNMQELQGSYLPNSIKYENNGWFAGWLRHTFDFDYAVIKDRDNNEWNVYKKMTYFAPLYTLSNNDISFNFLPLTKIIRGNSQIIEHNRKPVILMKSINGELIGINGMTTEPEYLYRYNIGTGGIPVINSIIILNKDDINDDFRDSENTYAVKVIFDKKDYTYSINVRFLKTEKAEEIVLTLPDDMTIGKDIYKYSYSIANGHQWGDYLFINNDGTINNESSDEIVEVSISNNILSYNGTINLQIDYDISFVINDYPIDIEYIKADTIKNYLGNTWQYTVANGSEYKTVDIEKNMFNVLGIETKNQNYISKATDDSKTYGSDIAIELPVWMSAIGSVNASTKLSHLDYVLDNCEVGIVVELTRFMYSDNRIHDKNRLDLVKCDGQYINKVDYNNYDFIMSLDMIEGSNDYNNAIDYRTVWDGVTNRIRAFKESYNKDFKGSKSIDAGKEKYCSKFILSNSAGVGILNGLSKDLNFKISFKYNNNSANLANVETSTFSITKEEFANAIQSQLQLTLPCAFTGQELSDDDIDSIGDVFGEDFLIEWRGNNNIINGMPRKHGKHLIKLKDFAIPMSFIKVNGIYESYAIYANAYMTAYLYIKEPVISVNVGQIFPEMYSNNEWYLMSFSGANSIRSWKPYMYIGDNLGYQDINVSELFSNKRYYEYNKNNINNQLFAIIGLDIRAYLNYLGKNSSYDSSLGIIQKAYGIALSTSGLNMSNRLINSIVKDGGNFPITIEQTDSSITAGIKIIKEFLEDSTLTLYGQAVAIDDTSGIVRDRVPYAAVEIPLDGNTAMLLSTPVKAEVFCVNSIIGMSDIDSSMLNIFYSNHGSTNIYGYYRNITPTINGEKHNIESDANSFQAFGTSSFIIAAKGTGLYAIKESINSTIASFNLSFSLNSSSMKIEASLGDLIINKDWQDGDNKFEYLELLKCNEKDYVGININNYNNKFIFGVYIVVKGIARCNMAFIYNNMLSELDKMSAKMFRLSNAKTVTDDKTFYIDNSKAKFKEKLVDFSLGSFYKDQQSGLYVQEIIVSSANEGKPVFFYACSSIDGVPQHLLTCNANDAKISNGNCTAMILGKDNNTIVRTYWDITMLPKLISVSVSDVNKWQHGFTNGISIDNIIQPYDFKREDISNKSIPKVGIAIELSNMQYIPLVYDMEQSVFLFSSNDTVLSNAIDDGYENAEGILHLPYGIDMTIQSINNENIDANRVTVTANKNNYSFNGQLHIAAIDNDNYTLTSFVNGIMAFSYKYDNNDGIGVSDFEFDHLGNNVVSSLYEASIKSIADNSAIINILIKDVASAMCIFAGQYKDYKAVEFQNDTSDDANMAIYYEMEELEVDTEIRLYDIYNTFSFLHMSVEDITYGKKNS